MIEQRDFDLVEREVERGERRDVPTEDAYADMLVSKVAAEAPPARRAGLRATAARGRSRPASSARVGRKVIALFAELDGRFPNHLPDPDGRGATCRT